MINLPALGEESRIIQTDNLFFNTRLDDGARNSRRADALPLARSFQSLPFNRLRNLLHDARDKPVEMSGGVVGAFTPGVHH